MWYKILETTGKSVVFWIIGILAAAVWMGLWSTTTPAAFPPIPEGKWQAVFLTNNQVYFGRLENVDAQYVTLSDVYYLRTASALDDQAGGGTDLNLIRLGGEVHGPENTIYIPKSSILFWENMKDSSSIVQTITNTKR